MGNILNLNFIFSHSNKDKIFIDKNVNGCGREEFIPSAIFNWIEHNYLDDGDGPIYNKNSSISVTTDYDIDKSKFNIFLLECRETLRDLFKGIFTTFPNNFINNIKDGDVKLLISCMSESTPNLEDFELKVEKFCLDNDFPLDTFIFMDGNKLSESCTKFKWYYVPHFIYDVSFMIKWMVNNEYGRGPTAPLYNDIKKHLDRDYYFISFNKNNWRKHRVLLGCYLAEKNNNKILWSYLTRPSNYEWMKNSSPYIKRLCDKNIEILNKLVPKLILPSEIEIFSNNLNDDNIENLVVESTNGYTGPFDKKISLNSYFHIVTETEFENTDRIFFTEKILKPIINLQPFIVISSGGFLRELKSLGFKTYDGIFDESYDEIEDKYERINFIFKEIDRILEKPKSEISELYSKYSDVCIYNRQHLLNNFVYNKEGQYDSVFKDIPNG